MFVFCLSATETLYDLTSFGFIKKNFEAIVQGIVQAIVIADSNLAPGYATITNDTLLNTNAKYVQRNNAMTNDNRQQHNCFINYMSLT